MCHDGFRGLIVTMRAAKGIAMLQIAITIDGSERPLLGIANVLRAV